MRWGTRFLKKDGGGGEREKKGTVKKERSSPSARKWKERNIGGTFLPSCYIIYICVCACVCVYAHTHIYIITFKCARMRA